MQIQKQLEFVGQLKELDGEVNAADEGNDQSIIVLTILEKLKKQDF